MAKRSSPETKPEPEPKAKRKPKGSGLAIGGVPRVNLLPPSELQRRAAGVLVRRWIAGLLATAVVVSGLVATAYWVRGIAEQQLTAEQARTIDLNIELADLSHVSQAFAQRTALTTLRAEAMGSDLEWRALISDIAGAIPSGASLTGFELIAGANPLPEADPATGIGLIGRLTLGTEDPADQNRLVDALRGLDIVLAADAGSLSASEDAGFTFNVEFVADQSHYSGDHVPEGGAR